MISFGERCYSNQYDEISDDEFSDDEISGFANTTKFPMLSTPCESEQICTDPDRYSRIVRKLNSHKFSFRKRN